MKNYFTLGTGQKMPMIGLGTGKLGVGSEADELDKAVEYALQIGYRHFDTGTRYGNEHLLGRALKKWINNDLNKREELFIVTKLPVNAMQPELVEKFLQQSLEKLEMDYVDLYLIHWPVGLEFVNEDDFTPRDNNGNLRFDLDTDLVSIWNTMERIVDSGKARGIGLSNFNQEQIERLLKSCRIPPSNLQVEVHAYFQQKDLRKFCLLNDIQICAYAPLASPFRRHYPNAAELNIPALLEDAAVKDIASNYGKTSAQILLRYLVQACGVAVIPKTNNPCRLRENFEIFDFDLSSCDIDLLNKLDRGLNGRTWRAFDGAASHPECPF